MDDKERGALDERARILRLIRAEQLKWGHHGAPDCAVCIAVDMLVDAIERPTEKTVNLWVIAKLRAYFSTLDTYAKGDFSVWSDDDFEKTAYAGTYGGAVDLVELAKALTK